MLIYRSTESRENRKTNWLNLYRELRIFKFENSTLHSTFILLAIFGWDVKHTESTSFLILVYLRMYTLKNSMMVSPMERYHQIFLGLVYHIAIFVITTGTSNTVCLALWTMRLERGMIPILNRANQRHLFFVMLLSELRVNA